MKTLSLILLAAVLAAGCTQTGGASGNVSASCPAGSNWCGAQERCLSAGNSCLTVATEPFPPYNYLSSNGTVAGQSTEIVKEIMRRLNETDSIRLMNWSDAYSLALKGPDTALYSTERTPEREKLFKWVGPIGTYDYEFFGKNDTGLTVSSLDDARKTGKVCVVKDDARAQFLQRSGFSNLVFAPNDMVCAGMISAGEADLWLGSVSSFNQTVGYGGYDPSGFKQLFSVERSQLYIAFSNDTPDAEVQAWQQALDGMKADGTFDSMYAGFTGPPIDPTKATPCFMEQGDWKVTEAVKLTDMAISGVESTLGSSAGTVAARSGDWNAIRPLLQNASAAYPAAAYWYALANGSYYTLDGGLQGVTLSDRPYFPLVLAGNASIGTTVASRSTGLRSVVVAVPVASDGKVSGVLGASMFLDNLSASTGDFLRLPPGVLYFAVDGRGQTVLSRNPADIMSADSLLGDAQQQVLSAPSGNVSYTYAGKTYAGTFQRSDLTGWTFVLSDVPSEAGTCPG